MSTAGTIKHVLGVLETQRFDLSDEYATQQGIGKALTAAGISHAAEVRLDARSRLDFLVEGGITIEVKLQASAREIHRQLLRYCQHERVQAVILATARTIGLPSELNGKPCHIAQLGRGWL
jgi:anthranilate phosphoribosyltransferase